MATITRTFTLLVTISDEEDRPLLNPEKLASLIKADLESGHCVPSAEVDAFAGDIANPGGWEARDAIRPIKAIHRALRDD